MNSLLNNKTQILHFLVRKVQMCIYLNYIAKVMPLVELEKVPGGPPYLVGLMNLEGRSIPVVDLAIQLGLQRTEKYSLDIPILLFSDGGHEIGIIVDDILGISDVDKSAYQMQEEFKKAGSPYLASIVNNFGSALLLNSNYILDITMISTADNKYG